MGDYSRACVVDFNGGRLSVSADASRLQSPQPALLGLTEAEVAERVKRGETNDVKEASSRTYGHIIRGNVFTRFNAILGTLFVVIIIFGSPRDALFGFVLVVNTLIGIVQEVRAKWTLDRLSLISEAKARVMRDGETVEIPVGQVVLDDVLLLHTGDQVVADGEVIESAALEIDESLLTGESVPMVKQPGDEVKSGSFTVAGAGHFRATKVGADAYARKLAAEAKQFQLVDSELRDSINMILRYITWVMLPVGILLLASQLKVYGTFHRAATGTVAGLVGMVPEGLVLLVSIAFAVSVVSLGRKNVLVQELPAVEGLARVDVVCLDKNGTLTEGKLEFGKFEELGGGPADQLLELAELQLPLRERAGLVEAHHVHAREPLDGGKLLHQDVLAPEGDHADREGDAHQQDKAFRHHAHQTGDGPGRGPVESPVDLELAREKQDAHGEHDPGDVAQDHVD